ncbi:universal stress protein [Amycolatopsis sp. CA-161197]|uniref:universal stress protein n=1 Tax=Amycolatopsis sp. CA-161197 TaxID=3239922 RepID=UPI003D9203B5
MDSAKVAPGRLIVVGVDGSHHGDAALRWTLKYIALPADTVHAMMARPARTLLPGTSYAFQPHSRQPEGMYSPHAHIARIRAEFPAAPEITVTTPEGDAANVLVASSADADLLVVGSHGSGRATDFLMGSVSRECVRNARCPVVVITPEAAHRLVPEPSS